MANNDSMINLNSELGIDSRYKTKREREQDSIALMQARLERLKNLPKQQILRAKLMQLKLRMEDFLHSTINDNQVHFTQFLEFYVDTLYSKRSDFTRDLNITAVSLSQVINKHREPKEEFLFKLLFHSEMVFKDVCKFDNRIWLDVYFRDKINQKLSLQSEWKEKLDKQVRFSELPV